MNQADRAKLRALMEYLQNKIQSERWWAEQFSKEDNVLSALRAQWIATGLGIALRQLAAAFNIPVDLEQEEQS